MEVMLESLIKQSPWAVVVLIMMIKFFKFTNDLTKQLTDIGTRCHEHTSELNERTSKAIENAANIIQRNSEVIGTNTEALREICSGDD
jgi:hypothetical protein